MATEKPERLTQAEKEKLEAELAELEGPRRAAMVEAIATARGFGNSRRTSSTTPRRTSRASSSDGSRCCATASAASSWSRSRKAADTVGVGSQVELEDEKGELLQIRISGVEGVSPDSPVGRALLGKKAGDEVDIEAPRGAWRAKILSIDA